jgi:RecA-family ATPase
LGKVVILEGLPGEAKTTLMLDIAARITTGRPMPLETDPMPVSSVVFLTGEDGLADTIRPRIDAAGGDPYRLLVVEVDDDSCDDPRDLVLPREVDLLRPVIYEDDVRLVVVDPLKAFLASGIDDYRDQHIRAALRPLARLAEELQITIVLIRHWNKTPNAKAINRGGGSVAYGAAARVVLVAASDPDDETRHVLAVAKNNLAEPAPSLSFHVEGMFIGPDEDIYTSRIVWDGESPHTADSLAAQSDDAEEKDATEKARDFVRAALNDGPRKAEEVTREAEQMGIKSRTLGRARLREGVTWKRIGFGQGSHIELALPAKSDPVQGNGQYGEAERLSDGDKDPWHSGQEVGPYDVHTGQETHSGLLAIGSERVAMERGPGD